MSVNEYDALLAEPREPPVPTEGPAGNEYDAILIGERADSRTRLRQSLYGALEAQPDRYAESQALASRTGLPTPVVDRNRDLVEKRAKLDEYDTLLSGHPALAEKFSDPEFAKVAHDDVPNLVKIDGVIKGIENPATTGSVLRGLGQSITSIVPQIQTGMELIIHDLFSKGTVADEVRTQNLLRKQRSQSFDETLATPDIQSKAGQYVYGGAASLLQNLPGLAASVATGTMVPALTFAGLQTGAPAYAKYQERGGTPGEAALGAGVEAMTEVLFELAPMGFLVKKLGKVGAGEFLKGYLGRELPSELATTLAQTAVDTAVANPDKSWAEWTAELPDALAQTGVAVAMQTGVMTGAGSIMKVFADRAEQAQQADRTKGIAEALVNLATESKLRERSPDAFEAAVETATKDAPVTDVYIAAEELSALYQDKVTEVFADAPEVLAQYAEALSTNGDIRIPIPVFAARIAAKPEAAKLIDHIRFNPNAMSAAEAKAFQKTQEQELETEAKRILSTRSEDDAWRASAETVRTNVLSQLQATQRFRPEVNESYATLASNFYTVQADRLGITPEEMFKRYPLTVRAEQLPGIAFDQSVFHGTPHRFDRFDLSKIGTGEGNQSFGWGIYVAESRDVARSYRTTPRIAQAEAFKSLGADISGDGDAQSALRQFTLSAQNGLPWDRAARNAKYRSTALRDVDEATLIASMQQWAKDSTGSLYQVDLPDDVLDKMLDWDAPLSQQPESVRKAVDGIIDSGALDADSVKAIREFDSPGSVVYKLISSDTKASGQSMDAYPGAEGASRRLAELGIPGIKYFDGGSRAAGDGTRNYVIFDQALLDKISEGMQSLYQSAVPQTETPEFKRWFGESKVVDADGKPLVVYHGTQSDFDTFDADFPKSVSSADIGYFFTSNPEEASNHAAADWWRDNPTPNVMPVYLSIKNPEVIENIGEPARWYDTNGPDIVKKAIASGKDGLIVGNDEWKMYVSFSNRQIKSATGNRGTFDPSDPNILNQSQPFRSALIGAIESFKQSKASGEQWLGTLRNTPGIKPEELDYYELGSWLKGQKSVTREQLLDYLRANELRVTEKVLDDSLEPPKGFEFNSRPDGTATFSYAGTIAQADSVAGAVEEMTGKLERLANQWRKNGDEAKSDRFFASSEALTAWFEEYEGQGNTRSDGTKFDKYQLPGGSNYRELLLTLPYEKKGIGELQPGESLVDAVNRAQSDNPVFHSSHFDEPNILAHIRFNERWTSEDGTSYTPPKKVLFIEEIQSDWHQKGRKQGYGGAPFNVGVREDQHVWVVTRADGKFGDVPKSAAKSAAEAQAYADAHQEIYKFNSPPSGAVPDAPFKTTWPMLAMKRAIRWAAENGFDSVAWTTGEQQAARYDLSKHVSEIRVAPVRMGGDKVGVTSGWRVTGKKVDGNTNAVTEDISDLAKLEGIIGKEPASKVIEQLKTEPEAVLRGLDLKVGGEGMKGFYDDMLVKETNKFAKKFGGKVGVATIHGGVPIENYDVQEIGRAEGRPWRLIDRATGKIVEGSPSFRSGSDAETWVKNNTSQDVHSLDITTDLRKSAMSGMPLFQSYDKMKRGAFSPETSTITLLEDADLTTFLHELGHFQLEVMADMAAKPDAPAEIQADMAALLKWFGVKDLDDWHSMTLDQKREHHETFARGFEAYLFKGESPNEELRTIFGRFRSWLLQVYKHLKALNVTLTPEVTAVFDRMLASRESIAAAEERAGFRAIFSTAEEAGMTAEQWLTYQANGKQATEQAGEELERKSLRDMQWLSNAKARELKKLQLQHDDLRRQVRMEVRREVLSQPVYRAWSWLTAAIDKAEPAAKRPQTKGVDTQFDSLFTAIAKLGGMDRAEVMATWGLGKTEASSIAKEGGFGRSVLPNKDGRSIDGMLEVLAEHGYLPTDEYGKADPHSLEDLFDRESRGEKQYATDADDSEDVPAVRLQPAAVAATSGIEAADALAAKRMTREADGVSPEMIAESLGFTSGDHLVQALVSAESPAVVIERLTDDRMLERHGELVDPKAVERAADAAIHNQVRAKFVAAELTALEKANSAKVEVGRTRTGRRLTANAIVQAAKDYATRAVAAMKIADVRRNYRYAVAEGKSARATEKALKAGKLADAVQAKRSQILASSLLRASQKAVEESERAIKYLAKFQSKGTRENLSDDYLEQIDSLLDRFDLRKLSGKAIASRKSLAQWIEDQREQGMEPAFDEQTINDLGRKPFSELTMEEMRGVVDAVKNIEHLGRLKQKLLTAKDQREFDAVVDDITTSIEANATKTVPEERMSDRGWLIDPKRMGKRFLSWNRKFASFAREMDGFKDAGVMWARLVRPANEAADLEAALNAKATEAISKFSAPILADRHLGRKRFFKSMNQAWSHEEILSIALHRGTEINRERVLTGESLTEANIQELLDTLTEEDWAYVRAAWDHLASYKPLMAEKQRRVDGVEPEWVEGIDVVTKFGTFNGGYYPIKYDPLRAKGRKARQQTAAELQQQLEHGLFVRAQTRRGHLKARVESTGRPLRYDLNVITDHVAQVIHDLAWHEYLIDANRLLRSGKVAGAITKHQGINVLREIETLMKDIAVGNNPAAMGSPILNHLRYGVSIAGLSFNVMNALINLTGVTQSMERIGAKWVWRGASHWYGDAIRQESATKQMREKSGFMRLRGQTMFRELNELRNKVSGKGTGFHAVAFLLQIKTQVIVDVPTWWGAYEKAMAQSEMTEDTAIALADQSVRDAQGSGQLHDLSGVQRDEVAKMFTVFYSFFNATYNRAAEAVNRTDFHKPRDIALLSVDAALLAVVPSILYSLIMGLSKGDDEDELVSRMLRDQLAFIFGLLPFLREATSAGQAAAGMESYGYTGPAATRFFVDLYRLGVQTGQLPEDGFDEGFWKAANSVGGTLFHYPSVQVQRTATGADALVSGKTADPTALITGARQ